MAEKQPEFQSYPSVIDDDDKLSATVSNSNRSSNWSVHNEIGVDDSVSPATSVIAEKLYVALGKDLKEGKPILVWALKNSGGRSICILHVHQPDELIPCMGGNFPASNADAVSVQAHRQREKLKMHKVLNEYLLICKQVEVQAETLHIESDCIEKGIVKIISDIGMKRLVMGAAATKKYSSKMTALKSEKALYVKAEAPVTCHIWFVCKGHLIYKREGISLPNEETMHVVLQPNPNLELKTSDPVIARSVTLGPDSQRNHLSPNQNHHRGMSMNLPWRTIPEIYTDGSGGVSTSNSARHSEASSEEQEWTSRTHISHASHLSTLTSLEESGDYQLYNQLDQAMAEARNSRREAFEELMRRGKAEQDALDVILKARSSERLYAEELKQRKELEVALLKERLEHEQAKTEATNLRREAFQESMRREKAEQEAVDATHKVRASEKVYDEELKRRKELEAALLTERLERENIQNQRDKDRDELQHTRDQLSQLERRITESARLFINYKKESDALQIESENAHQLAEDLRRKQAKFSSVNLSKFFSEIPFLEIEEANK